MKSSAKSSAEQFAKRIMSGHARGIMPAMVRAGLSIAEPFYACAMLARNRLFDFGLKSQHQLGRPVISIGNITTGGTGKTPAVQWIARQLFAAGHHPGCLMRGYGVKNATQSDEATLLSRSLGIPVYPNPDRIAAAKMLLQAHPETDVILLDDGFQHRRVHRDLNLVLIDATNPFGYGHVLPRGMLREPLRGLRRADVLIVTRCDQVNPEQVDQLEQQLRAQNERTPILRSEHRLSGLKNGEQTLEIESLKGQRVFCFCGIGNPQSFQQQILGLGAIDAGNVFFGDHHNYSTQDLENISTNALERGAQLMVTTEKDWVKIERLDVSRLRMPVSRVQLEMYFSPSDSDVLVAYINKIMALRMSSSPAKLSAQPSAE